MEEKLQEILNFRVIYWHLQISHFFGSIKIKYNKYHKENGLTEYFKIHKFRVKLFDIAFIIPLMGIFFAMFTEDCRNLERPFFNIYHIFTTVSIVLISLFYYYP